MGPEFKGPKLPCILCLKDMVFRRLLSSQFELKKLLSYKKKKPFHSMVGWAVLFL